MLRQRPPTRPRSFGVGSLVRSIILDAEVLQLVKHVVGSVRYVPELQQKLLQRLRKSRLRALFSIPSAYSSSILSFWTLRPSSEVAVHDSSRQSVTVLSALPTTQRAAPMAYSTYDHLTYSDKCWTLLRLQGINLDACNGIS